MRMSWLQLLVLGAFIVLAQATISRLQAQQTGAVYALALTACGTGGPTVANGAFGPITMNTAGSLCVNQ